MRKFLLVVSGVMVLYGCRKTEVPTVFIRMVSEYSVGPYGEDMDHSGIMFGMSPHDTPEVVINGRPINLDGAYTDIYLFWDSLPMVKGLDSLELLVRYRDLNDEDREATAKNRIPGLPTLLSKHLDRTYLDLGWASPDPGTVDFVTVSCSITCEDSLGGMGTTSLDTLLPVEVPTLHIRISDVCPTPYPIVRITSWCGISNVSGPWSKEGDNVKGAKGQYFAVATLYDTLKWGRTDTSDLVVPREMPHGIMEVLNRYLPPPLEIGTPQSTAPKER